MKLISKLSLIALIFLLIMISLFPQDGEDAETLLNNADRAMYHVKNFGKNNFNFFSSILNDEASKRLQLEREFQMAQELGYKIIAEGVETEAQLDFLKKYQCQYAQGFLFSKPLNITATVNLLRTHQPQEHLAVNRTV